MTRNEIVSMAREAGSTSPPLATMHLQDESIIKFAALVAAAEREACADTAVADKRQTMPSATCCSQPLTPIRRFILDSQTRIRARQMHKRACMRKLRGFRPRPGWPPNAAARSPIKRLH